MSTRYRHNQPHLQKKEEKTPKQQQNKNKKQKRVLPHQLHIDGKTEIWLVE